LARLAASGMLDVMADDDRKTDRFAVRRDRKGWSVVELLTGEAAVIASSPQVGLSEADAQHTASLLNQRTAGGDRTMRR
jgi:hypothetical protein